ncbi:hypothetical protein B0H17DRAFT_1123844 [Mycena rosella]|uniref:Uncharacterized protein n=1 Tax=Mycena rosella TaxID=1033263 RepID=A0AAD7H334_MYCRO|nr:hypothetical protein B0H17DRAFT_1123844 [Mycena rosella]
MSTLYVPLPSDIASSILAALSAPGSIVDPSLEDLRARLASTLNSASHSPAVQAPSTAVASNTSTFATSALPPRRRVAPLPVRRRYGRFASEPLDAQRWQSIALDETVPGARPLLSPLQLPTATAPSKRSAPDLSESDSESELARQAKRPKLYIGIPAGMGRAVSQSNEQQESDDESAGDVENAQAAPAHRRRQRKGPRKKCVRKGDAQPAGIDANIGHVACPAYGKCAECSGGAEGAGASEAEVDTPEEQVLSDKAQRGRKPKNVGWKFDPEGGPLLIIRAGQLLGRLLGILTTAGRNDLEDFLQPLPVKHLQAPSTLDAVIERIQYLHVGMKHVWYSPKREGWGGGPGNERHIIAVVSQTVELPTKEDTPSGSRRTLPMAPLSKGMLGEPFVLINRSDHFRMSFIQSLSASEKLKQGVGSAQVAQVKVESASEEL